MSKTPTNPLVHSMIYDVLLRLKETYNQGPPEITMPPWFPGDLTRGIEGLPILGFKGEKPLDDKISIHVHLALTYFGKPAYTWAVSEATFGLLLASPYPQLVQGVDYPATNGLCIHVLSGHNFLASWGKDLTGDRFDRQHTWVVENAQNLIAFYRSYNETARALGFEPLFPSVG